ncbi:50S ribosomal protein L25 [Buchnera aphidicola (Ceratoglyphina bambusae)]|uniref:50S ribosomal protein L25 n=1 Tax=Buchnera aphidicola TaxID=9 RepID=UPI0031B84968
METILNVNIRNLIGTNNINKLKNQNKCPAILYSIENKSVPIELDEKEIFKLKFMKNIYLKKIFIILNKKKYLVKIKEIQRHVFKNNILHIDFLFIKQIY